MRDNIVNVNTSSESTSSDTKNSTDIRDRYEYRKIMQSQKNSVNKISNSSQPLIKELINWQSGKRQANIQAELSKLEVRTTNSV